MRFAVADDVLLARKAVEKLILEWDRDSGHIWMTGPAVTVFEGEVD